MMQGFSENQIRALHTEFKSQKKYTDKLAFFDRWFGIIPFPFPDLDPQLSFFFQKENDKSFKLQCMSVFYKGFYDAFRKRVNGPGKKRKFIELYLYAQGIIYANYIGYLKTALRKSRNPLDLYKPLHLDLPGKLELMKELGIIDFLKS